jgi:protein YIPF1/2
MNKVVVPIFEGKTISVIQSMYDSNFEIDGDSSSFAPVTHNSSLLFPGGASPSPFDATATSTSSHISGGGHINNNKINQTNESNQSWYNRFTSCFQISSLACHFDVDTIDVKERIEGSILHCNKPFHFRQTILHREGRAPDLYGPVWICMTLVFFLAVTSNTSKYRKTDSSAEGGVVVEYDITHLASAFSILVFFTFVLPSILYLLLKFGGVAQEQGVSSSMTIPTNLVELISIYGYSLVPYLPATILCLVPSIMLEWVILVTATILSLLLVLRNIMGSIFMHQEYRSKAASVSLLVCFCHVVLCFIFKFKFYHHRTHVTNGGSSNKIGDDDDGIVGGG